MNTFSSMKRACIFAHTVCQLLEFPSWPLSPILCLIFSEPLRARCRQVVSSLTIPVCSSPDKDAVPHTMLLSKSGSQCGFTVSVFGHIRACWLSQYISGISLEHMLRLVVTPLQTPLEQLPCPFLDICICDKLKGQALPCVEWLNLICMSFVMTRLGHEPSRISEGWHSTQHLTEHRPLCLDSGDGERHH